MHGGVVAVDDDTNIPAATRRTAGASDRAMHRHTVRRYRAATDRPARSRAGRCHHRLLVVGCTMRRHGVLVCMFAMPMRGIRMRLGPVPMPSVVRMRRFEVMMRCGLVLRRRRVMMGGCGMHLGLGHCGVLGKGGCRTRRVRVQRVRASGLRCDASSLRRRAALRQAEPERAKHSCNKYAIDRPAGLMGPDA